jgi:methionyl-tRNA formyltransferase
MRPYYYQGSRYFAYGLSAGVPSYLTNDLNADPDLLDRLRATAPHALLAMGWPDILKPHVLAVADAGCVGVHPSALPHYRGGAPLNWQILEGQTEIGVSAFFFAERIDAGAVIAQRRYQRPATMSVTAFIEDVYEEATWDVLREAVERLRAGDAGRITDAATGSYRRRRSPADSCLDLRETAARVRDLVLAQCYPFPAAFIEHAGYRLSVNAATSLADQAGGRAGEVLAVSPFEIDVRVRDGVIRLSGIEVEPPAPLQAILRAGMILEPGAVVR